MSSKDGGKKGKDKDDLLSLMIGTAKHQWPFSRGLIVKTLMNAGASRKEASAIARHVEQALLVRRLSPIKADDLHELVVRTTREVSGRPLSKKVAAQTPFFIDIQVRSATGKAPFSRAVLARRLEDTGLDTREAYAAAREVDLALRRGGVRELDGDALQDATERVLTEHYGQHFARTYRFTLSHQGRLGVIGTDSASEAQPIPFSKGILMQSLLAAGAGPDTARTIARAVQRDLQSSEDRVVTRSQIRREVQRRLRDEAGRHVGARYGLLRSIKHLPRPLVVLIGGVSGTGKSHLASEVAYRLGIPRITNTDTVREVMRSMVSPQLIPSLHTSTFNAWKTLVPPGDPLPAHPNDDDLQLGFREQVKQVSLGLDAILNRLIQEGADVVAEGVHLVPGFLDESLRERAVVVPLLLVVPDEESHLSRFRRREEETDAARPQSRYQESFGEIRRLQTYLTAQAERHGVPVLESLDMDELIERTVDIVLSQLPQALRETDQTQLLDDEDEVGIFADLEAMEEFGTLNRELPHVQPAPATADDQAD